MFEIVKTALMVIDIQGTLARITDKKESFYRAAQCMIEAARIMEIPIIWTEQNPAGMGPTIPEIADLLKGVKLLSKLSFSCCGEPEITQAIKALGRQQILLTGIESHVCVYQTAMDLLKDGYQVQFVADAVSARNAFFREIGYRRMQEAGALITSTEMILFELMQTARYPRFKQVLKVIKKYSESG